MVNLFFVKERCPLILSLAGYLMNKGEICVEIYDDIQFIIKSNDVTSLCFAASNVDTLIKINKAKRIFVQDESKNLSAVTLGSVLNELPVYLVCAENSHQTFQPPILGEFVNRVIPTASTQNFLDSACGNELREKVADEELTLVTSTFPPKNDWFYEYLYYSVDPKNLYSYSNFMLPNYIPLGNIVDETTRTEAIKVRSFLNSRPSHLGKVLIKLSNDIFMNCLMSLTSSKYYNKLQD